MKYLTMTTATADIYEGLYWQAKLIYSNRWGHRIEFQEANSDRIFTTTEGSIIERLQRGEDPDAVALALPMESND